MTLLPEGETLRRALLWLAEAREQHRDGDLVFLVEQTAKRFDLSPAEEEWLLRIINKRDDRGSAIP